jgi:hypothetical protein
MTTFHWTWTGLLLGLLLVGLFYGRLAKESERIVVAQEAAVTQKALEKARRDSIETREDRWRRQLVAALRERGQLPAATTATGPDTTAKPSLRPAAAPGVAAAADSLAPVGSPALARTPKPRPVPPARWDDPLRRQLPWLLPVLALAGGLVLTRAGWVAWQERRLALVQPHRADEDQPLLRVLLHAYAGHIGRILPIPRQVKRFASKARLQNNLLFALSAGTQKRPAPFQFDASREILAFLLLLLLEQETDQENKAEARRPSDAPPVARVRDLNEEEFGARIQSLFAAWHGAGAGQAAYAEFRQSPLIARRAQVPAYQQLAAEVAAPAGQALLIQLHRLNTGLLV